MPLYQTGGYRVKPSAVNKVKEAIKDFVAYVQANEPGTQMYLAWQEKSDPTRFLPVETTVCNANSSSM